MSDRALQNAKALKIQATDELSRLEAQARLWQDRLRMADQFIDQWNAFATGDVENLVDQSTREENKTATVEPARKRPVGNSRKDDVAAGAYDIIKALGYPVSRSELFRLLIKQGFTIEGTDPEGVMNTMLWRTRDLPKGVIHLRGHGYWPADTDYLPGDYLAIVGQYDGVPPEIEAVLDHYEQDDEHPHPS